MSGFLSTLAIREIDGDDRRWILLEPCVYHLRSPHGDEWVEAPTHFVTDFGSIPRLFWNIRGLSPFGKLRRAYVIHDKLFLAPVVRSAGMARAIGLAEANAILIEAAEVLGANWLLRRIIWAGVATGGRLTWRRYRKAEQDAARP
jgi:hypothetical protein